MSPPLVFFQWTPSSYFGWGVYGLQLMLNWARRSDLAVACTTPIDRSRLALNTLEFAAIEPVLGASRDVCARLAPSSGKVATASCAVLHGLANNIVVGSWAAHDVELYGKPSIGVIFSENTSFDDSARERAKKYPLIIAGSTWNRDVLVSAGIENVTVVLQGVDATHFHPAPRAGILKDRFVVFSGGKLEHRKAQDLVVAAFRIFAQRHREALLLTAWSSPWPKFAATVNVNPALAPIGFLANGQADFAAWTAANGIPAEQTLHLGAVPNAEMPRILREVDVALFPNRAEGGTNLVAMECLATGLPTVLSANTGHRDLIRDRTCFPLERQGRIDGAGCEGWGESDVDEIVETLEAVYRDRAGAAERGRRGAEMMQDLTWARQLDTLATTIRPYIT